MPIGYKAHPREEGPKSLLLFFIDFGFITLDI
jgi:hypothetical protein